MVLKPGCLVIHVVTGIEPHTIHWHSGLDQRPSHLRFFDQELVCFLCKCTGTADWPVADTVHHPSCNTEGRICVAFILTLYHVGHA